MLLIGEGLGVKLSYKLLIDGRPQAHNGDAFIISMYALSLLFVFEINTLSEQ